MPGFLRTAALALAAAAAPAAPPLVELAGPARTAEALTVYSGDLALITETRGGTLPAGRARVRFTDLPDGIDPRSVRLLTGIGGAKVLEQVWRTDLIAPQRLLQGALGREVTLVTEPPAGGAPTRVRATLLSLAEGPVWKTPQGIEIGHPGRVVLDDLPENLLPRPALEWLLESSGGSGDLEASYLASGIGWSAEHTLEITEEADRGRLSTWVTVGNHTGTSFADASLRLVAGAPHRVTAGFRQKVAAAPVPMMRMQEAVAADSDMGFVEEAAFEYHTYTLGRRVGLPDGQEKQLALHEAAGVPIERRYIVASPGWGGGRLPGEPAPVPVQVRLDFANTKAAGLGVPLPGGVLRIYQRSAPSSRGQAADTIFLGEDRIPHTAVDEKRSLLAGMSFDVVADRRQTHYEELVRTREVGFEIKVRNRRSRPVRVEVLETLHGEWRIIQSSHPHEKRDAMTVAFPLDVKAGGETVLSFRARLE